MLSKIKYRLEILRVLKPFSFGVKRFMLFILCISLISMALNFINPVFYKIFIDDVIIAKNLSLMPVVVAGYLSVFAVNIILGYARNYCNNKTVNRVTFKAKIKILRGFFARDFSDYDNQSVGDIKMRMEDDTGVISSYAYNQTIGYIISYITLIISAVLLLLIEWRLAVFAFASIPLTFWLDNMVAKRESVVNNSSRENDQKMSSWFHASVQGWREIKALNLQKHEELQFVRYIHKFAVYNGIWINYWVTRVLIIPKIKEEFLMQFSLYFFGGLLIINNQFEIGSLLIFMQYYNILSDSLKIVSGTDAELLSSKPQSDRLLHELKMEVNSVRPLKQNIIPSGENIIEFRGVTFSYANSNQTVIDNLSFAIKKGKRVAITGKSGAGKTTVLKLMSGMLRPSSGEVLFYGENVGDIDLYSLHKHLGFIMQENILFNAAIKENLLYAKADASTDEIETACQKAFIWDFIKTLPDGLETIIGERGIKLSGGQKQRLILARQFLRGTNDMFILDEATSALDQYSESIIQDAISSIGQDKTIIVVAHRKSSISLCDRVIEL